MKRLVYLFSVLALAAAFSSCEQVLDGGDEELLLEVNANNISGQWQLSEWNGGPLNEGTYVYIDIVRNDRTYTLYQNVDSFNDVPHKITGSYYLETDPAVGAVIRGNYDHDSGDWAYRYIITDLTHNQMTWTAKSDSSFVQVWHRVDVIPVVQE